MKITLDGRKTTVKNASSVGGLVQQLKLNNEEVLVKVNGKLAADGAKISPKDEVKVMRVIFGG
jgi:sulfur carrier protein ThiS